MDILTDCQKGFISGTCTMIGISAFMHGDLFVASILFFIALVIT